MIKALKRVIHFGKITKHVDFKTGYTSYNHCELFVAHGPKIPMWWGQ